MEKKNLPVYKFMALKEIIEIINFDEANRTSFIDAEENKKNGYNNRDHALLNSRLRCYKNEIFKKNDYEWRPCCPMIIHSVKETGKKYLSDGQGRFRTMQQAVQEGVISDNKQIPVLIIECNTLAEMRNDIKAMNTNNRNWNSADVIHSNAVALKGDSLKIEQLIKSYQDKLQVNTLFIPTLIVLSDGKRKKDEIPMKMSEISPYHKEEYEFFNRFFTYVEQREDGVKRLKKRIKVMNTAIALHSFFQNLMKACEGDKDLYKVESEKLFEKMLNKFDTSSEKYLLMIFNGDKVETKICLGELISSLFPRNTRMVRVASALINGSSVTKVKKAA